jgi:hypothetical protein
MPKVECDIENCKHNRDGECVADVISLWADHVCDGGCDQGWKITERSEDVE